MSSQENKVAALRDFLVNRAALSRMTNFQEAGRVMGTLLYARDQRHTDRPVRREAIVAALRDVDRLSLDEKGVLLSALVVHFWDNEVGHRFHEMAVDAGVADSDTDPGYRKGFHAAQVVKAFAAYENADIAVAGIEMPTRGEPVTDEVTNDDDPWATPEQPEDLDAELQEIQDS